MDIAVELGGEGVLLRQAVEVRHRRIADDVGEVGVLLHEHEDMSEARERAGRAGRAVRRPRHSPEPRRGLHAAPEYREHRECRRRRGAKPAHPGCARQKILVSV